MEVRKKLMLFNSILFIILFPMVALLYHAVPKKFG